MEEYASVGLIDVSLEDEGCLKRESNLYSLVYMLLISHSHHAPFHEFEDKQVSSLNYGNADSCPIRVGGLHAPRC